MNTIQSSDSGRSGVRDRTASTAARALRGAARLVLSAVLGLAITSCGKPAEQQGAGTSGAVEKAAGRGEVGTMAPAFTLPDLTGNTVALSSLKGKVVILDFWATWCPPCREEIPHFVNLQSKYRDQGLQVVGLSLDAEGAKKVAPFAEEHDVNYTMLIANDEVAKAYGNITMIPTTFVLDREGKIVQRFIGATPVERFEEVIRPLLAAG